MFVSPAKADFLGTGFMIEKSKRTGEGCSSETAGLRERGQVNEVPSPTYGCVSLYSVFFPEL